MTTQQFKDAQKIYDLEQQILLLKMNIQSLEEKINSLCFEDYKESHSLLKQLQKIDPNAKIENIENGVKYIYTCGKSYNVPKSNRELKISLPEGVKYE